jgi:hypothetical protein
MGRLALALSALIAVGAAAIALAAVPAGDETQVNQLVTQGQQDDADITMDPDGDFSVAWQSDEPDGDGADDVYIRRFASPGFSDRVAHLERGGDQDDPSIASDANGNGVVAFHTDFVDGQGIRRSGIRAHRFGNNSGPLDEDDIDVDVTPNLGPENPAVAMDPDGDFVVAWQDQDAAESIGIFAQRYDESGASVGAQIPVSVVSGNQGSAAVAMDADGDFVVAWDGPEAADPDTGVFAQRYAADGTPSGGTFLVNTTVTGVQESPAVGMDADGDFVVAWHGAGVTDPNGVFVQRYDGGGEPQGDETIVNETSSGPQQLPSVTLDPDGDFAVTWDGNGAGDNVGVFTKDFAAGGTPLGEETLVNETTADEQQISSVSSDANGEFVVSWETDFDDLSDTEDVFVRRFAFDAPGPDAPAFTDTDPDSPANHNQPRIKGSAEAGSTVRLYTDPACSGEPVGTGTATEFASPGLQVGVPDDATRTFYGTAAVAGEVSPCSTSSIAYVEDSLAPASPSLTDSDPDSPAADTGPRIKGSAEADSTVRLYTDAACSTAVAASGTAANFASPGLQVAVAVATTTTFYATATDRAGNVSPCSSSSLTYVQAGPPPDVVAPLTAIVSAPSGTVSDRTPSFTFTADEAGVGFECSIDGGPFAACSSPFTAPSLGGGPHRFAVRARDAAGNLGPVTTVDFSVAQTLEELTQTDPPTLAQDVNVAPVGDGPVLVGTRTGTARAGARAAQNELRGVRFVPLEQARQIPVGSFLDTSEGTVELLSARNRRGATQSGRFVRGIFQVLQSRNALTELRLKGSSFRRCGRRASGSWWQRAAAAAAQVSRRAIRRLRSNATGSFRTRGRHSAATVRGTVWETTDRCDGTLTKVARGAVAVRDFRRRKTVVVRAGKRTEGPGGGRGSYLARAR